MNSPHSLTSRRQFQIQIAFVMGVVSLYLYFNLFTPRGVPMYLGHDDDKLFLGEAMRLLRGEKMYRDFFEFYLPGTDVFYALIMRAFGVRAWIPNVCLVAIGIAFVGLSIDISRRLIPGFAAVLPGLLFLVAAFHGYRDAAPHWYSNFLIVAALAVLIDESTRARLIVAGILIGLATFFAQHHGILAAIGIGAFIVWEGRKDALGSDRIFRRELDFIVPFALTVFACLLYFVVTAGPSAFIGATV